LLELRAHWALDADHCKTTSLIEFKDKKVVLVAVPGAFTPTCQVTHITGYLSKLGELKAKGADLVVCIAYNDPFVMSAWGKANGVKDDSLVRLLFLFLCPQQNYLHIPSINKPITKN
jgi:peroxiredoxin